MPHNNNSTTTLNDCIITNQCGGVAFKICMPVFEKANHTTNGSGNSNAMIGRGGSFEKSLKKPLSDNADNRLTQTIATII